MKGVLLLLFAAVLWATTGTAQSFAPSALSSYWIGSLRLVVAGLFFATWLLVFTRATISRSTLQGLSWPLILCAALSMALYNLVFFAGIRATSVSVGTAMALGSGPLWAGLLQSLLSRRVPALLWWLGVGVAVIGLCVSTTSASGALSATPQGVLLCLLAGLCYAVYAMATKQLVSGDGSMPLLTGAVFILAAVFAVPAAAWLSGPPVLGGTELAIVGWLGVFATGVAYLLFSAGLRHLSSATGVALALAEPIAAVGLAIVVVGERPGMVALAGLLGVLLGLAILVRSELTDH